MCVSVALAVLCKLVIPVPIAVLGAVALSDHRTCVSSESGRLAGPVIVGF